MPIKSLLVAIVLLTAATVLAENKVLGEVGFHGATKIANDSGVWVDGQYLGYVKELKGSKKVLLLPGAHDIAVRQDGYLDFRTSITMRPGEKQVVEVRMEKDTRFVMPSVTSEIKMSVNPDRAAVFLDDLLVGHAGEFGGVGRSLLVAPGHRKITISLPGYRTFEAELNLEPRQKIDLKTELQKGDVTPTSASR
jgi:PEGA domain-containing protein